MHEWADQLVSAGRRVVLPDLYDGSTVATEDEAEKLAQATLNDPATLGTIAGVLARERVLDRLRVRGG